MLADEGAVFGLVGLVVAVRGLVHDVDQRVVFVLVEQGIPLAAPDNLDDVPAGTAEEGLKFLHDLAVAANRAVEALQVAVDHEGEVVELLVGCQLKQAARFGLVHFAVAEEGPDLLLGGVLDAAVLQVAVRLSLVDRVHRANAHGHGGEFPEVRKGVRVRVGRQGVALSGLLLAESVHVLFAQASFEERAGVHAGGGMTLEEDLVAATRVVLAAEEVVEAHFVKRCGTGIGGDVPTDPDARTLPAVDHDGGVPAHVSAVASFNLLVTREFWFLVHRNRVHVISGGHHGDAHTLGACAL